MDQAAVRAVPFFRNLPGASLAALIARLRPQRHGSGTVLFQRGEAGETMYFVESGQLEAVSQEHQEPLAALGPGSLVGEISLLLDQPRSATVRVVADAQLWALSRADLDALLTEHPLIGVELSRELSRRLVATSRRLAPPPITQCIAVLGSGGAVELARALQAAEPGRVGIATLTGASWPTALPDGVVQVAADVLPDAGGVSALARGRSGGPERVLVLLPPGPTPAATAALAVSEYAVIFGPCPDWVRRGRSQLRVLRCDGSSASLQRTVRWIRGRAVGLALSSGGSKTVAHIGVMRVLREMGITVDAMTGTSGGACIAAGLACGMAESEMLEQLRTVARSLQFRSFDFNLVPRTALSKGARLRSLFDAIYSGRSFADTEIPLWLVAADLATGEEVVIDSGPLADGVRASMSMPVFFNPWPHGGRLLIDGAVVNPLPASVLREAGIRFVIGSNVAGQELRFDTGSSTRVPNMLQTVNRVMNSMEREMLKAQTPLVDVMIRPRVVSQSSFDFSRMDAFLVEGERAARSELAETPMPDLAKVAVR
jgi:NTE family protein